MSMSDVQSSDLRPQRLGEVFNKVTDSSVNAITEADLSASFSVDCGGRTLRDAYGSNLQKLFINFMSKAQTNITSTFQDICIRHSVEDILSNIDESYQIEEAERQRRQNAISQSVAQRVTAFDGDEARKRLMIDMKIMEKNMILAEMSKLDAEVARLRSTSSGLQAQVAQELAAVEAEREQRYKMDS